MLRIEISIFNKIPVHEFCQATRNANVISLCSGFLLFRVTSPSLSQVWSSENWPKREERIYVYERVQPPVNLVESYLFCALTLPRSATSASVKIDAYERTYNHDCRTSSVHIWTHPRSNYTYRNEPLISDPWPTLTKFRSRNFINFIQM